MAGELARRVVSAGVERRTARGVARIGGEAQLGLAHVAARTQIEQARQRAHSAVGEFAMDEVAYLKGLQRQHETANPDAAEAIALIVNTTITGMARSIVQFRRELDR